jgi:hypothetical protein
VPDTIYGKNEISHKTFITHNRTPTKYCITTQNLPTIHRPQIPNLKGELHVINAKNSGKGMVILKLTYNAEYILSHIIFETIAIR